MNEKALLQVVVPFLSCQLARVLFDNHFFVRLHQLAGALFYWILVASLGQKVPEVLQLLHHLACSLAHYLIFLLLVALHLFFRTGMPSYRILPGQQVGSSLNDSWRPCSRPHMLASFCPYVSHTCKIAIFNQLHSCTKCIVAQLYKMHVERLR